MILAQHSDGGTLDPGKIASALRTTRGELARLAGLSHDAIRRKSRIGSVEIQRRLGEMVEVINRVEPRFGSNLMAYAWYRSQPLPGFSGQTAMQLVKDSRANDVLEYLAAVDASVYA